MATYSSVLAWKIPWTEEPAGPQSMGSHRAGHDLSELAQAMLLTGLICKQVQSTPKKFYCLRERASGFFIEFRDILLQVRVRVV